MDRAAMTIYTQVRTGHSNLEEFPATFGQSLGVAAEEAITFSPSDSIRRMLELRQADDGEPISIGADTGEEPWRAPPTPMVPAESARQKIKDAGLDLTVPDTGIRGGVLDILMERKRDEKRRQDIMNRAPSGVLPTAGRFGVAVAASMLDPLNVASAFIPVVSAARYTAALGRATSALGRAGTRARVGAVEGAVGAAVVEPIVIAATSQEQADYDLFDSLLNIGLGTALGGGLHVGFGAASDALSRGQHWSQARASEPLPQILERVEPEVREAALRTAVAQTMEGRAVNVEPVISYSPAVRIDGKIYTGGSHVDAIDRAALRLDTTVDELISRVGGEQSAFNELDGFVGPDGFVSRADAYARISAQETARKLTEPESIRTADIESSRAADERIKEMPDDSDMPEATLTEAVEDAQVLARSLGDEELVTRELADFDELSKTADAYGKAVRAAGACQLRRGAA
jgi:hypothetical protein